MVNVGRGSCYTRVGWTCEVESWLHSCGAWRPRVSRKPQTLGLSGLYFWTQVLVFMNWACCNLGSDCCLLSIVCIWARAKIGSYTGVTISIIYINLL
ncbi:hypothetical protein ES332_A04G087600v1 [Gossypium tomentosum]|uniref:Uncharacterized protein n=1 Tax=Gossypium tomentosum TaxID=34277 RepID=A0A5D2QXE7_GOSTO|nr:hypothetical protein ES332_A04G087600v1 [Gossypium tomentosum]